MSDQRETIVETVNGAEAPAVPGGVRGDAGYGADAREPGAGQLLLWLHLMLRGRYPLLIILSLILGGAMGYGGYRLGYKTFRSTSLIQIVTPLKLTKGSEDENATDTDGFVSTQAALLKSQRVIDLAMGNADWQALHRPVTETSTEEFAQMLSVMPKDRMIYVSFEDHDPKAAVVALKSVIEAYSRLYVEEEARKKAHRLQVLRDQEISLGNDDSTYKGQIDAITAKWGTSDLASLTVGKL